MPERFVRFVLPVVVVLGLFAVQPFAQSAPAQRPASPRPAQAGAGPQGAFRAGVDSVSVDAIVTDKQGRPVTDLTAQDFEIREAGKPQTVETFKLVQIDDGRDDPTTRRDIQSLDDQARETANEDNRLFVIFLDDYHVRSSVSLGIRLKLAQFVRNLTPRDLVALAVPLLSTAGVTFSRDHDATANQIMGFIGRKYDYTPRNAVEERYANATPQEQEQFRNDAVISALQRLCEYMGTLRTGRKTILYVSEGMTATLPAGLLTRGAFGNQVTTGQSTQLATPQQLADSAALLNLLREVFKDAARSNTAIYTLDPRGLVASTFGAEDNVTVVDGTRQLSEQTDLLRDVAEETGGRAIVGRNEPEGDLRLMVRDNSTYYLLSYTSSLAARDGKFHEIKVTVKRKDVEVRARKGYWAYSAADVERAMAPRPVISGDVTGALDTLASVVEPSRRRPIVTWLGAKRGPTQKDLVTFAWEASPAGQADALDIVDHVEITASSIYGDDLFKGVVPRDPQAALASGQVTFEAPAGAVNVRVVSQNAKGLRIDTQDAAIEAPDFTGTGPLLSQPFIYRGRTARDLQQVRATPTAVPTPNRQFARTERLLIRFGAYGPAGTSPVVTMRLLNQTGGLIAALPAPTSYAPSEFEAELGFGSFPPGDYLIEFAAESNGQTVKSLLAIRVTG